MNESQIIREASINDVSDILKIEKQVFTNDNWSLEMLSAELNNKNDRKTLIIVKANEVVAYCMTRKFENEIHIINMAVKSSMQGRGYGKLLLKSFLDQLPIKSSVFLEVKHINFPAINLYLSVGFKNISSRTNYYSDGSDALIMCLKK